MAKYTNIAVALGNQSGNGSSKTFTFSASSINSLVNNTLPSECKITRAVIQFRGAKPYSFSGKGSITITLGSYSKSYSDVIANDGTNDDFGSGDTLCTSDDIKGYINSNGRFNSDLIFKLGSSTLSTYWRVEATIYFDYETPYTVSFGTGTGGSVNTYGGSYYSGTNVSVTATPNSGYKFVKWSDGNTSATRTVTVTGNATYTAVFERLYYDVNYDNLLSFADWYYSNSNNPSGNGSGTVTADVINGTITVNGSGDFYTAYGAALPYYTIPVQTGQVYKFRYDCQATGGVQAYVFFLNGSGDYIYLPDGTYFVGCYDGSPLVFTPPSGCVAVTFRVGITGTSNAVFSNLALYKTSLDYAITNRQYRKSFVGGGAVGELHTPVIEGFDFKGWYTGENGTGTQIISSSKLSASTTVYSQWEEVKPEIKNIQMIYLDKQISETNKVPCGEGFVISVELS